MSVKLYAGAVLFTAIVHASAAAAAAQAQSPPPQPPAQNPPSEADAIRDEVTKLRDEFEQLRQQYDARLASLEERLATLQGSAPPANPATPPAQAAATPPAATLPPETPATPAPPPEAPQATAAAPSDAQVPSGAASAGGPEGSLPVYGNATAMSKVFNPDISVIGNFLGAVGHNDIEPTPSLELNEAEASFQAVVDPYAKADFFVAYGPDGAEIEEGYLTLTSLPAGLLMKVGKMRSAFGKVNQMHTHVLPWADRPLVSRNLLGGEEGIADSGISVSKLILNPWFFLEATGEVYRGESEVFHAPTRSDLTYLARVRGYHDISESMNLDLGTRSPTVTTTPRTTARRDCSAWMRPSGTGRCGALFTAASSGAASSSGAAGINRRRTLRAKRSATTQAASTSSPGAGSAALAGTGPSARRMATSTIRPVVPGHVLAQRVQPDPGAVPPDHATPRATRRASSSSSSCLRLARTAPTRSEACIMLKHITRLSPSGRSHRRWRPCMQRRRSTSSPPPRISHRS